MAQILITEDGKRIDITSGNTCLYSAPHNPPNTGSTYTRGTDLFTHKARSGKYYYFTEYWSMWQGEESSTSLLSRKEAIEFLQNKAASSGKDSLSKAGMKEAVEHFGEDIFSENA